MKCVALLSVLLVVSAVSMAQASRGAKDMLAGISGAHKHAALISGVRELLPPLPEAASLELELLPKQGRALLTKEKLAVFASGVRKHRAAISGVRPVELAAPVAEELIMPL